MNKDFEEFYAQHYQHMPPAFKTEALKIWEASRIELTCLIKTIHNKLEYGDIYQWDDGDECCNNMRKVVKNINK